MRAEFESPGWAKRAWLRLLLLEVLQDPLEDVLIRIGFGLERAVIRSRGTMLDVAPTSLQGSARRSLSIIAGRIIPA